MAKLRPEAGEVNARIVYWGVVGAGKRSSLAGVYKKLRPDHRGEMHDVPTRFDPSVSYTVLPIELGVVSGLRTRIEMVAVPGAPEHAPTRKQLLDQVDGVVLVVDCQRERADENYASLEELTKSLEDYGRSIDEIPLVVQYNKRDLSDAFATEELHRRLGLAGATVFETVAADGTGLLQALSTISKKVIRVLREESLGRQRTSLVPQDAATTAPAAPSPAPEPVAKPARPDPRRTLEDAILAEADHPEREQAERGARAAESLLRDQPWHDAPDEFELPQGARIGPGLTIVSVGEASRVDERSVRVPLVLGDEEGETSSLVLTLRLDPVGEESPD